MKKIKQISLQNVTDNFQDLNLQNGYIYIPDFKITEDLTQPYRSGYYCIGLLKEGEFMLQSNLTDYLIKSPAIMIVEPSTIKNWKIPTQHYKAESILIPDNFLQEKIIERNILTSFSDLSNTGAFLSPLTQDVFNQIRSMFEIINIYTPSESIFHKEIVHGVVYTIINIIGNLHDKNNQPVKTSGKINLKFRKLVAKHAFKERNIRFYADTLHVHPKYLSQIIQSETGFTAGKWIQNQVILEGKVLLQKEEMTIKEIADLLYFPDQSTFGKYFKKYAAMSPGEYRESIKK